MKHSTTKIHKPIYIYILTILFGPLAGGLMSGLDYKKFRFKEWIVVLLAPSLISIFSLFLFSLIFPSTQIPAIIIPIVLGYIYQIYQKQLETKIGFQMVYYSFYRSLAVSFIGMLILLIPLTIIFSIFPSV